MNEFEIILLQAMGLFEESEKMMAKAESQVRLVDSIKLNGVTRSLVITHNQTLMDGENPVSVHENMFTLSPSMVGLEYATESFSARANIALKKGWDLFWEGVNKIINFVIKMFKNLPKMFKEDEKKFEDVAPENTNKETVLAEINTWCKDNGTRYWIAGSVTNGESLKAFIEGLVANVADVITQLVSVDNSLVNAADHVQDIILTGTSDPYKQMLKSAQDAINVIADNSKVMPLFIGTFADALTGSSGTLNAKTGCKDAVKFINDFIRSKMAVTNKPVEMYDVSATGKVNEWFKENMNDVITKPTEQFKSGNYQNVNHLLKQNDALVQGNTDLNNSIRYTVHTKAVMDLFKAVLIETSTYYNGLLVTVSPFVREHNNYNALLKSFAPEARK